jgi:hypothetical protein
MVSFATVFRGTKNKDLKFANVSCKNLFEACRRLRQKAAYLKKSVLVIERESSLRV